MKVRFNEGYRGWITGEVHYPPGTVVDLPDRMANRLIQHGRAEPYEIEATEAATELAVKLGVDLTEVKPSGKGGRILVSDVRKFLEAA